MTESKLAAAVCAVMTEVGYVQKGSVNTHHRYRYASDADLLVKLQPAMASHGLCIFPSSVTRDDSNPMICHLIVTYTLMHSSGESVTIMAPGSGSATKGSEDKAAYKAMTGAYKYALRQLFAVPTGDDPEKDETAADVAAGRRAENAHQTEQRQSEHHPSWEADRAKFCAALNDYGGYDAAAAFTLSQGWGKPSAWASEQRAKFLADLRSNEAMAAAVKERA